MLYIFLGFFSALRIFEFISASERRRRVGGLQYTDVQLCGQESTETFQDVSDRERTDLGVTQIGAHTRSDMCLVHCFQCRFASMTQVLWLVPFGSSPNFSFFKFLEIFGLSGISQPRI